MNENLRLVLRLHKDGHLNEDEAVSLIQGLTVKDEKKLNCDLYYNPIDKYGYLTSNPSNCTFSTSNTVASTGGSSIACSSTDKCTTATNTPSTSLKSLKKKITELKSKF